MSIILRTLYRQYDRIVPNLNLHGRQPNESKIRIDNWHKHQIKTRFWSEGYVQLQFWIQSRWEVRGLINMIWPRRWFRAGFDEHGNADLISSLPLLAIGSEYWAWIFQRLWPPIKDRYLPPRLRRYPITSGMAFITLVEYKISRDSKQWMPGAEALEQVIEDYYYNLQVGLHMIFDRLRAKRTLEDMDSKVFNRLSRYIYKLDR